MAAITPHLGEEQPLAPEDRAYQNCAAGEASIQGLGQVGVTCPTPGEVVGQLHAGLVELASTRYTLEQELARRTLTVVQTGRGPAIKLTPPLTEDAVPWRPMSRTVEVIPLLTWTSKMGAPSFSLPAGHTEIGGACPGAAAGQSTSRDGARRQQERVVLNVLNDRNFAPRDAAPVERIDLGAAVCEHCYATDGNYRYADNTMYQMVRYAWASWALSQPTTSPYGLRGGPSNLFVDMMVEAIDRADYNGPQDAAERCEAPQWVASGWRFFRIHDSGDFGVAPTRDYFLAWKAIADCFAQGNPHKFKPIMFWAPTRMWAVPGWIDLIEQENGGANYKGNFAIRPSGYELNQHAPSLRTGPTSGWAAASTVYADEPAKAVLEGRAPKRFDWNCQAYAVEQGPTCRGALSPPLPGYEGASLIGCRACWMLHDSVINYTAH
jgi:hypothetical protein